MALMFTITAGVTTALFIVWAWWALREAKKIKEPRFARMLQHIAYAAVLLSLVGIFFFMMGFAHMHIEATGASQRAMGFGFVVMAGAIWLARRSTNVVKDVAEPLRKAERMMGVLSTQIPETSIRDMGLTAREIEVVSVIASGSLTDQQIAEKLFISKATAATHVRNVLKKSSLNNRRDLMLLSGWKELSSADRPARAIGE